MKRTLAWSHCIRQARSEREAGAAIVEREAGAGHDDARTEFVEQRIDERHHVAVFVGDGEIHRLARDALRARIGAAHRLRAIDVAAPLGDERLGENCLRREREEVRVTGVPREIGVRELLRLDEQVQIRRGVMSQRFEIIGFEDLEHLEYRDPLIVRGQLPHPIALEVHRDRRHPRRRVFPEVVHRDESAKLLDAIHDALSERAPIQRGRPLGGDLTQRAGVVRIREPVAGLRRHAVAQEGRACARVAAKEVRLARPVSRDHGRDDEAIVGVADRGRDRLRERDRPVLVEQRLPAGERARDRDRLDATRDVRGAAAPQQLLACHQRTRAAARVERDQSFLFGAPEEREHVATDASHHRLDDGQHRRGGDRGVDRVAAVLEDVECRGRRERLARGRDAVGRIDGGPPRHRRNTRRQFLRLALSTAETRAQREEESAEQ